MAHPLSDHLKIHEQEVPDWLERIGNFLRMYIPSRVVQVGAFEEEVRRLNAKAEEMAFKAIWSTYHGL